MSAGYTQEQDGARSMRRLLALYYALLSGALLVIGALTGITAGIYGGLGCALVVLEEAQEEERQRLELPVVKAEPAGS